MKLVMPVSLSSILSRKRARRQTNRCASFTLSTFHRAGFLLLIALATTGCDRITGVAEQKTSDAEAIGYACRVSLKKPEECMKENEAQSPNAVLTGWKEADKDISENTLDPSMGQDKIVAAVTVAASAPEAANPPNKGEGKTSGKAAEQAKTSEKKPTKSQ
ncbi:MAG: hypothetical protein WC216_04020 [Gallionella sp.]|jgi:hypothetical protein